MLHQSKRLWSRCKTFICPFKDGTCARDRQHPAGDAEFAASGEEIT